MHESCQRQGTGKKLFEYMLHRSGVKAPQLLAYDRPSEMFLSFLRSHYKLDKFNPQANNYVVFDDYFSEGKKSCVIIYGISIALSIDSSSYITPLDSLNTTCMDV